MQVHRVQEWLLPRRGRRVHPGECVRRLLGVTLHCLLKQAGHSCTCLVGPAESLPAFPCLAQCTGVADCEKYDSDGKQSSSCVCKWCDYHEPPVNGLCPGQVRCAGDQA